MRFWIEGEPAEHYSWFGPRAEVDGNPDALIHALIGGIIHG